MDFAAALVDENDTFADVLDGADETTPVPTCPGWTLRQLLRHVGRGHRWAAQIVAERRTDMLDPREVRGGKPPHDGAIDWLRTSAPAVVDAVEEVGIDTSVWSFLGPRPARWWIRRRLHEVTVHRADAQLALDRDFRLSAERAADAVSEWLEIMVHGPESGAGLLDVGQRLGLHATDTGDRWLLTASESGLTISRQSANGSTTVGGAATDLLLAVTRRVPTVPTQSSRVTVVGDAGVWQTWLDRTGF